MVQKRGLILAGVVILALLLISPLTVLADAPTLPDSSPVIISTEVFENVLTTSDALILFEYYIPYATPPTDTADQLYSFSVLTADGATDLGDSRPYPYHTGGYNYGVSGIYVLHQVQRQPGTATTKSALWATLLCSVSPV